jgi:Mg2+/Co2+ transporter CorB
MQTLYTEGFKAGVRHQRESILDFIRIHQEQNVIITVEDIAEEIEGQYRIDMESHLAERRTQWGQKR